MKENNIEADDIVSLVKEQKRQIEALWTGDNINFMGCSEGYCEEKINALISVLKDFKQYLKRQDKEQRSHKL